MNIPIIKGLENAVKEIASEGADAIMIVHRKGENYTVDYIGYSEIDKIATASFLQKELSARVIKAVLKKLKKKKAPKRERFRDAYSFNPEWMDRESFNNFTKEEKAYHVCGGRA